MNATAEENFPTEFLFWTIWASAEVMSHLKEACWLASCDLPVAAFGARFSAVEPGGPSLWEFLEEFLRWPLEENLQERFG